MIRLLSAIGRCVTVVAAIGVIVGSAIFGYSWARALEVHDYGSFAISGGGVLTPLELLYSIIGCGVGLIGAGAVFGAIATLYEIRDNLRLVAAAQPDFHPGTLRERQEPHL
jgi:hypothetical protein